jgi:hypothetical protein
MANFEVSNIDKSRNVKSLRFEAWHALRGTAGNGGATLHAITEILQLGIQKADDLCWTWLEYREFELDTFDLGLPQISGVPLVNHGKPMVQEFRNRTKWTSAGHVISLLS